MKYYNKDLNLEKSFKIGHEFGTLRQKQLIHCKVYVAILCSLTLGLGAVFASFFLS